MKDEDQTFSKAGEKEGREIFSKGEGREIFSKGGEEDKAGRELIERAEESELKGSIEQSLSLLRQVNKSDHGEEWYIRSRERLGEMYLKYRKDKKLYITCYKEMNEVVGSNETHLKLGDAFMRILEPEEAIHVYEKCLKKNPKNVFLIKKVGSALVLGHFYDKAITYYKAAIKSSGLNELRHDLALLLFQLKRHCEAKELTRVALEKINSSDPSTPSRELELEARLTFLLSQIQNFTDSKDVALETAKKAYQTQVRVNRRISSDMENTESSIRTRELLKE